MLRDRRHLRRRAVQLLLVWLFGVATGIAQACTLGLADHQADAVFASAGDRPAETSHGHGEPSPGGADQANCLDFCEQFSVTVPSLKAKLETGGDLQPAAILPSPSPWMATSSVWWPARPAGVTDHRGAPPPRIAFQRLAL